MNISENVLKLLDVSYSKEGKMSIKKTLSNLKIILLNDERFKSRIQLNRLTQHIEKNDLPLENGGNGRWEDVDSSFLGTLIDENYSITFPTEKVTEAVNMVAVLYSYNPLQDYLNSISWDNVPRVDNLFTGYFSAENNSYSKEVSRVFLISAVARALENGENGCKVDTVPILEGGQGLSKSLALRKLAVHWFKDETLDIDKGKDTLMQLQGVWIYEYAELASMSKADVDLLKSFISKQTDTYRAPYGRFMKEYPRRLVFVGTVNHYDSYLKDPTGNRRYLPIRCGDFIDLEAIERDRDQLWAEAVHRYKAGEKWYWKRGSDIDKVIREEVSKREESDAWLEPIAAWLKDRNGVTIQEIWEGVFEKPIVDLRKPEQTRIGGALKSLGWERRQVRRDGIQIREYHNPQAAPAPTPAPESVIKAAMAVIYEQCQYDLNSNEKVDVESKLGRAFFANKDVFDVAENFGINFQVALKSGKSTQKRGQLP